MRSPEAPPAFVRLAAHPEAWTGGGYEVQIEMPRLGVTARRALLRCLWRHAALDGPYLRAGSAAVGAPPPTWTRADLKRLSPPGLLYGRATLAGGAQTTCSAYLWSDDTATWLTVGLPLGGLAALAGLPVGAFPFDDGLPLDWRADLDAWLCDVARWVHAAHPVRLALVGWTDGHDDVTAAGVAADGVPDERWVGFLVPGADGTLDWHGPNQGSPVRLG